MASYSALHRRRDAQRSVDAAKVIIGEPERISGFQMLQRLLKQLVSRVIRRIPILMLKFCRSMCDVQIRLLTGFPMTSTGTESTTSAGL